MTTRDIIDEPTRITASTAPTVDLRRTADAGDIYVVRFDEVSVRLTEGQLRGLVSSALSAQLDEDLED